MKINTILSLAILATTLYRQSSPVKQDDIPDPVDLASYGPLWGRSVVAFNGYVEMYQTAAAAGTNTQLMREGLQFIQGTVGSNTFFAYSDLAKSANMATSFATYETQRADLLLAVTAALTIPLPNWEAN